MTIELPHQLTWVHELCGGSWPAADEDRLFDLARSFRAFAAGLRDVDQDANWVARDVVTNNEAPSIDAFGALWRQAHYNHQLAARATDLIGEMAVTTGISVQAAKITLLGILSLTATRILRAKALAHFLPAVAADEAFRAAAAGRVATAATLRRLQLFIEVQVATNLRAAIVQTLAQITPVDLPAAGRAPDRRDGPLVPGEAASPD
ncbi:hypothetical protein [Plantactinospora sp. KLBMP9567]|uniref:WXG100-like domain-containing protein n=1 Tax=Plantactinospora sp. KLBMP9567 TaxID=3085900 RepID=UPI002981084A|nr:hypothetical protein [Plantactinospora sp. KLBMP9567]MDW5327505.1 hypothetical protein [Plantactinospora sp. KLBMP9567]